MPAKCLKELLSRRCVKQVQLQGNTKEATTFTVAFSMDRAPSVHAGTDRAHGQDRRRLAGAALARDHSSRHVRERLGHADHDPAARGHIGRREELKQRKTSVDPSLHASEATLAAQRSHVRRTVLHPATEHVVLAVLRRGRLPQL